MNIQTYHHRAAKKFKELQRIFSNQVTVETKDEMWQIVIGGHEKGTVFSFPFQDKWLVQELYKECKYNYWCWSTSVSQLKGMINRGETVIAN